MAEIEQKIDMSLDELIKTHKKEEKKSTKFNPGKKVENGEKKKRGAKGKVEISKSQVQQQGSKIKRQAAMNARRGIETEKLSANEIQKKAQKKTKAKATKKTTVTLANGGIKSRRGAATSTKKKDDKKKPTILSIPASKQERPITIKDFVLPKDTQLKISFEPKVKTTTAPTKKSTKKKSNAKSINLQTGVEKRRATQNKKAKDARQSKMNQNRDGMDIDSTSKKKSKGNYRRRGGGVKK
mmetsp:Transcript_22552/g.29214  ORF Transcript_22552/g.29214 Transcript_22552/m.29214 type:complete len:240 (+) Transcript_22552:148-867(+)|eukprot:CAMPEP_0197288992 /NCGR_PEP_ID=MMETSP0890-20130614/6195_1 /TAXON_ID=44058 ORGANISM="Aureoumbra lagunensis, Strain CCMP1510" /NCGR_SAMPLE_ID=MMETSP0890 /ASSEMBLY_ACC=CAM_ASM_000533 /LENGTH=239 /DNA_ID=CAMNT_0042760105 /DNA_START=113 /DNA_END=832 /DNA_ORIENTATION=-